MRPSTHTGHRATSGHPPLEVHFEPEGSHAPHTRPSPPTPSGWDHARATVADFRRRLHKLPRQFIGAVVSWPRLTAAAVVVVVAVASIGFIRFEMVTNPADLYVPDGSPSSLAKELVESHFGAEDRPNAVYAVPADGAPALAKANLLALMDLFTELTLVTATVYGREFSFEDLCRRGAGSGECTVQSVLQWWDYNRTLLEADSDVQATLQQPAVDASGHPILLTDVVGRVFVDPDNRTLSGGSALAIYFNLENNVSAGEDDLLHSEETCRWESAVGQRYVGASVGSLRVFVFNNCYFNQVMMETAFGDVYLMGLTMMAMVVFAAWEMGTRARPCSNIPLALGAVVSVVLAIAAGFGVGTGLGITVSPLVTLVSFVIMGVGIDDSFVITQSMAVTRAVRSAVAMLHSPHPSENHHAHERRSTVPTDTFLRLSVMTNTQLVGTPEQDEAAAAAEYRQSVVDAMLRADATITITSVTDIAAFLSALSSTLPVVRHACLFGALGIAFDFFTQVTLFVAVVALFNPCDEFTDARGGRGGWRTKGLLCCVRRRISPGRTPLAAPTTPLPGNSQSQCSKEHLETESTEVEVPQGGLQTFLCTTYPDALFSRAGKASVLLAAAGLVAAGVWAAPQVESRFEDEWLVPDHHPFKQTYTVRTEHFGGAPFSFVAVTGTLTGAGYGSEQTQSGLVALAADLRATDGVAQCYSWYDGFRGYYTASHAVELTLTGYAPPEKFHPWLAEFLGGPGKRFEDSVRVVRTAANTSIDEVIGGKFTCVSESRDWTSATRLELMNQLQTVAEVHRAALESRVYTRYFMFLEGIKVLRDETITSMVFAALVVLVMSVCALGSTAASLLIFVMVAAIDLNVLAALHYSGTSFNVVSSLILILAVGFSADYSVHVAHAFLASAEPTAEGRGRAALAGVGRSVLCGGFSTFLAVSFLPISSSYLFRVALFQSVALTVLFGLFHGLAVLPVLLVLLVPGHKSTKTVVPTSRKVRIEVKPWNVDDNKDSLA